MKAKILKILEECCSKGYDDLMFKEDREYIANAIVKSGNLISLPCKVGDTIWYISYIRIEEDRAINILEEWDVEKIDIYNDSIICRLTHKGTDHYNTARNDEFGKSWFLTKAEAEAKLKELQNER